MIALARLLSILHISMCMPFRYLAGKCHEFKVKEFGFGIADMSRVLTTLHQKLHKIKSEPDLILDQIFMNNIFQKYRNELPPFAEYWDMMFKKKQMKVIAKKDGSKVVHIWKIEEASVHSNKDNRQRNYSPGS